MSTCRHAAHVINCGYVMR